MNILQRMKWERLLAALFFLLALLLALFAHLAQDTPV
jgi:preprotein translocase subunit SecG